MNHFNPILNKYEHIKKKLKAKVTEKKELKCAKRENQYSKSHPAYKIKSTAYNYNRRNRRTEICQRTTNLSGRMLSTDKDMVSLSNKYNQMDKNLDILDSQDISLSKRS